MMKISVRRKLSWMIKRHHLRHRSEIRTHFGLAGSQRRVVGPDAVERVGVTQLPCDELCGQEQRAIVASLIARYSDRPDVRELLHRRLIGQEQLHLVADELGFRRQSARRILMKARRYLRQYVSRD